MFLILEWIVGNTVKCKQRGIQVKIPHKEPLLIYVVPIQIWDTKQSSDRQ